MKLKKTIITLAGLVILTGLSACNLSLAQDITPPPGYQPPPLQEQTILTGSFPLAAPDPAKGGIQFLDHCQPCHGDTGLGDGPQSTQLPVEVAAIGTWRFASQSSPLRWYSIVSLGKLDTFMPPFANSMSAQERWDTLAYIYSLSAAPELLEQGETVYEETCQECHGDSTADSDAPDFTDQEVMAALSGDDIILNLTPDIANENHTFETPLTAEELQAISIYVRSLTFVTISEEDFQSFLTGGGEETADLEIMPPVVESEGTPVADSATETTVVASPTQEGGTMTVTEATPEGGTPVAEITEVLVEEEAGFVTGTVTFFGGDLPEGLSVVLSGFDHFEEVLNEIAELTPDGSYRFEGIDLVPERIFFIEVDFQDAVYRSEFVTAEDGDTFLNIPLTVYETTTDISDLYVSQLAVFFEFVTPEKVQVVEWYMVLNDGAQTVAPGSDGQPVVTFSLPEEVIENSLIFQDGTLGQNYVLTPDGFGVMNNISPSDGLDLIFAYELSYEKGLELSQTMTLPIQSTVVFVPGDQVDFEGVGFSPTGMEEFNGEPYQVFLGRDYAIGDEFSVKLSGRNPGASTGIAVSSNQTNLIVGGAALLVAIVGVIMWLRKDSESDEFDYEDNDTPEAIMDRIVALDEAFEDGGLDEGKYKQTRSELKDQLRDSLD